MIYVILDENIPRRLMLMKVGSKDELERLMKLSDTVKTMGAFTDEEIKFLHENDFVLISA